MAAAVTIGYAHFLQGPWPPFSAGVRWMPLAGAFVVAAALLPGRRAWRVSPTRPPASSSPASPSPASASGWASSGARLLRRCCAFRPGGEVWATRRVEAWLFASLLAALVGGLAGAPDWWWLSATAAADAVVLGILAVRRARSPGGRALAWGAAALAAVAFGADRVGAWSTGPLLAASASAAAVSLTVATVLGMPRPWAPGAALWQLPSAALAVGAV